MKQTFLLVMCLCLVGCWQERQYYEGEIENRDVNEAKEYEESIKASVTPVAEKFLQYCREVNAKGIYSMYSEDLKQQTTEANHQIYVKKRRSYIQNLGKTSSIREVMPYKQIYAVVKFDSSEGPCYWGLVKEDDQWKFHRTSGRFIDLIKDLR